MSCPFCNCVHFWQPDKQIFQGKLYVKKINCPLELSCPAPLRNKESHPYSAHSASCCFVLYLVLFKVQQHIYSFSNSPKFQTTPYVTGFWINPQVLKIQSPEPQLKTAAGGFVRYPLPSGPAQCPRRAPLPPTDHGSLGLPVSSLTSPASLLIVRVSVASPSLTSFLRFIYSISFTHAVSPPFLPI